MERKVLKMKLFRHPELVSGSNVVFKMPKQVRHETKEKMFILSHYTNP